MGEGKQESFKKRLLLTIGVIPLGILILGAGLYFLGMDIKGNVKRVRNARQELLFRSKIGEKISVLKNQAEQAKLYSADLENILISRDQLANFSRDVNAIAKQNQIDLTSSFSGETPASADGLGSIGLTMTAAGSLENIINFLKAFNESRYSIKLNFLDFVSQGEKFKALFNGQIFFFKK
ncbi:MAG: hypothetical protein AAB651_00910 [Patescibacteria group bacterium]